MTQHRVLVGVGVLFVSLVLMTTQTQAEVQLNFDSGQYKGSNGVVFMNHEDLLRVAKNSGLKVHMLKFIKLSKHDLEKLGKLSSKGCGCAVPEDDFGGGWKCLKGCLGDWGVSAITVAACAIVCTENLVGCAICVGVQEWIVAGCAIYCTWPFSAKNVEPAAPLTPKLGPSQTHSTHAAKLSLRAARSGSSR